MAVQGSTTARKTSQCTQAVAPTVSTPKAAKPVALRTVRDGFEGQTSSGGTRAPQDPRTIASTGSARAPRRGITATGEGASDPLAPSGEQKFLEKGAAKKTKSAERMLRRAGFAPGSVDSKLTPRSREALAQFQEAAGLPATGELDQKTFNRLKAVESRRAKSKGRTVGVGQRSQKILEQEKRLKRLGYDPGKADGTFDQQTASAVRNFKADQKELKGESGLLGKSAADVLARESNAFNHAPYRGRVKNTAAHRRGERRTEAAVKRERNDGTTGLAEGSRGAAVTHVQQHLRAAGFDPQRTSGVFDERTAGAVRQFQKKSGLEATGVVDAGTWQKLRHARMEAKGATDPSQRIGERSGAVKNTERLLKKLGYNTGNVDGIYDARTQRAVDNFRKKERIGGKGKGVTANTLKRMRKTLNNSEVDANELVRIMPGLSKGRARALVPGLNKAMQEFGIKGEKRQAAFLAQVGHESVSLRYFEEIASGAAYEGRTDLGNVRPGDGVRYKGRGPIQLTGRANYRSAGKALGLPLEQKPWLASRPSVGFRIAGWFWKSHGLNELADKGAFTTISERINGGHNGLADRFNRWAIAKRVL